LVLKKKINQGWDVAEEWSAESVHFSGWSGTRLNARRGWVAAYGGSGLRMLVQCCLVLVI
jgi:hypothetical protein